MNRMYLTCRHHPTRAESYLIAERDDGESYKAADRFTAGLNHNRLQKWLTEHAGCGGTLDHFTVSFENQPNSDLPTPNPIADGIHLTLRNTHNGSEPKT